MFGQLLAVARNAFVESIRQPFYVVWLCVVGGLVVLAPALSGYTFDNDNVFATELLLSMLLVGGLILAAFTASGVISREIENRTALTVISKPIDRPVFILGKFLGIAGALVLAWWDWALLHLLTMRQGALSSAAIPWDLPVLTIGPIAVVAALAIAVGQNYLFHRHFGGALAKWLGILLPAALLVVLPFDHDFAPQNPLTDLHWPILMAQFFVLQSIFLFAAVATACSTRLGQVPTLAICLIFFFVGVSTDFYFGNPSAGAGQRFFYAAFPNLRFQWLGDALTIGTVLNITRAYFVGVTLYTALLVAGILGLAVALFQTRQAA